jgi:ABC-type spermidine/putrescine transport system permease subunit I
LFTFTIIWIGAYLLKSSNSNQQKSLGIALIFSNMPIARFINPIFGGGDEVVVLDYFLNNWSLSRIVVAILVAVICGYPIYKAFVTIQNKWRIALFLFFLLTPLIINILVELGLLNTLLGNGVLSHYWILGSPKLVTVWTLFVLMIFILFRKSIITLAVKPNTE